MPGTKMKVQTPPPKGKFYLAGREYDRRIWWKDPKMRVLYFYVFALIVTNTANGFDGSMMNGLQTLSYWQDYFDHPKGPVLGLFGCIMSVGSLIGLLITPYLLDGIGRKMVIVIGSIFMLLGIGLQAGSTSFGMFVAARCILGFGDILVIVTAPLLVAEFAPVQDRAILVTLQGSTYQTGAFIAALVTRGTLEIPSNWAWRAPSLLQAVFTMFMLVVVWWMPESPRYLVSKDRNEEALAILAKYHANGDEHDEVVQLEFAEITSALAMERAANKSFGFLDFFKTKGNFHRVCIVFTIGIFSQWSGNGLVSYYLNIILDSIGITAASAQLNMNIGLTTFNLVTNVFFSFFVDKWGRRPIMIVATAGMLVCFTIWTVLSARYAIAPSGGLGTGVVAMIFIYYFWYNLKSGLIASYTTEILTYNQRAKGFTVMEYGLYGSLFFNQYVNPIALDNIAWKYYIFYCCFLAVELTVLYFITVETRYVPLEEIAKYFDGAEAADVAAVAKAEVEALGEKGFTTSAQVEHVDPEAAQERARG